MSSFDIGGMIYFFFREMAVEHINCGKVGLLLWFMIKPTHYFAVRSDVTVWLWLKYPFPADHRYINMRCMYHLHIWVPQLFMAWMSCSRSNLFEHVAIMLKLCYHHKVQAEILLSVTWTCWATINQTEPKVLNVYKMSVQSSTLCIRTFVLQR